MKCEDFESYLADALGDELAPEDQPTFESHLAECEGCRQEYEKSRRAIDAMRVLSAPQPVSIHREGGRLVIQMPESSDMTPAVAAAGSRRAAGMGTGLLRYAATVLFAFTAGYVVHAGVMMADDARPGQLVTHVGESTPRNLRGSLVSAHARNPSYSGLGKLLAVITRSTP